MDKKFCVYIHTTPNNKKYIGMTCRNPEIRWSHGNGYKANKHFYNAILKYGWDNISHVIVSDNLCKEDACKLEQELIKKYNTTNNNCGYNNSIGGEWGSLGVKFTEERKQKISNALKGMKHTEEAKKKMSEGHKGKPTWNKGRSWTDEEKVTMRKAQNFKNVICLETDIIYLGTRDASIKTGINRSSIKDCCNHRKHHKTAGGYHWEYVN